MEFAFLMEISFFAAHISVAGATVHPAKARLPLMPETSLYKIAHPKTERQVSSGAIILAALNIISKLGSLPTPPSATFTPSSLSLPVPTGCRGRRCALPWSRC
jgi:hypothetical protein